MATAPAVVASPVATAVTVTSDAAVGRHRMAHVAAAQHGGDVAGLVLEPNGPGLDGGPKAVPAQDTDRDRRAAQDGVSRALVMIVSTNRGSSTDLCSRSWECGWGGSKAGRIAGFSGRAGSRDASGA